MDDSEAFLEEASILISGFGGQGVLLLGRLIAFGGMLEQREVTCFPSYGAEMRGGTANCTVVISREMIGSPIVKHPDILIALNEASLEKFQRRLRTGGMLFYNSSLIFAPVLRHDVCTIAVPASEIAASSSGTASPGTHTAPKVTQVRAANMVMLGALIGKSGIIGYENAIMALQRLTPPKRRHSITDNTEAIRKGICYINDNKSKSR